MTDLTDELDEYAVAVRSFLSGAAPTDLAHSDTAWAAAGTRELWKRMSDQLGAAGLLVPERLGGQGGDLTVAAVVLEELGAAQCRSPFLVSGVLAATALLACEGSAEAESRLAAMAAGDLLAAVAFSARPDGDTALAAVTVSGTEGGRAVSGHVGPVLDADLADLLLVVAQVDGRQALLAVDLDAPQVARSAVALLDLTRSCADVVLTDAPARVLHPDFAPHTEALRDLAHAALAAEMAGAARQATRLAVDHASVRTQFGVRIGSTQAVQRLCVDMYRTAEGAGAIARAACAALASQDQDASRLARVAKAYTSAHCPEAAEACVQVHGGMGFAWEQPAHLYLRRLRCDAELFGDAVHHRARLAVDLGLAASA
ncbi:acyl-CoA dehydrogenase family protein [Streptomyces sp. NPDC007264]|uniref:acyl-CoA dehydrogenase family protein n=1 Tax=Streptomyces sp. NPDC007264 TaxID=3364777 RepID=UPI0036DADC6F